MITIPQDAPALVRKGILSTRCPRTGCGVPGFPSLCSGALVGQVHDARVAAAITGRRITAAEATVLWETGGPLDLPSPVQAAIAAIAETAVDNVLYAAARA